MADAASSAFVYSTNAKPRGRPVMRSVGSDTPTTSPACEKRDETSSAVVSKLRFPTKTLEFIAPPVPKRAQKSSYAPRFSWGAGPNKSPGAFSGDTKSALTRIGALNYTRRHRMPSNQPLYRPLQVYAFDPSVGRRHGNHMTVSVAYEPLKAGPRGRRIEVIDYDGSNACYYEPVDLDSREV